LVSFNLTAFKALKMHPTPFPHIIVRNFIPPDVLAAVNRDFPPSLAAPVQLHGQDGTKKNLEEEELIQRGEVFGAYKQLLDDARSDEMRDVLSKVLSIKLGKLSKFTRVTLRGYCDPCLGKIHVDAKAKLVSWLLYLNEEPLQGEDDAGNLRLMKRGDLQSTVKVVPSSQGTLLAFKNNLAPKHGWHGFTSYTGPRRAIQVNYQTAVVNGKRRRFY